MERLAICPGSFDPITKGHEEIIRRAASLFDRVIVVVSANPDKNPLPNVEADCSSTLIAEYARQKRACTLVKGLRAVSDFDYEFQMALTNRKLMPQAETVFLTPSSDNMYLSSSMVRQIARFGGDVSSFVPSIILDTVVERLKIKFPETETADE